MEYKIGEVEMKFAEIIWEKEPISSGELAKFVEKELNWKKSTTYTVLKRLCEKGIFQNEKGIVTSKISCEDFKAKKSEMFLEETFKGSLPGFVAAFCSRKKLSKADAEELQRIINESQCD
ncbi:MAG: BlaI/MecI/CopY family transcriptional regulator [Lachnospiraceae bacterium]|nr:BlaI/MecI/CopY family transcriptional regulator [Lachnospiraceae bacterium]